MKTALWAIILVIIEGLVGALGPIYFKKGADKIDFKKWKTILKNKYLIIGMLVYGLSTLVFIYALTGGELSVLYPFVGLAYVWVCVYSIFLLKEKMNFWKWAGIIIIFAGVSLIGFGA